MNKNFWLNHETGGSVAGATHRIMVMIPEGGKIEMVGPVLENPDQVEVLWNGQSVWLFASDFEARAMAVPLTKAASVGDKTPRTEAPTEVYRPKQPIRIKPVIPKIRRFNAAGREIDE